MKRIKISLLLVLAFATLLSTTACTDKSTNNLKNTTSVPLEDSSTSSGAESMEELIEILSESYMFTEQQVNTMSNSMLFWCADEVHDENILIQDSSEVATILNNYLYNFEELYEVNMSQKIFITETEDITNEIDAIMPYDNTIEIYQNYFSDDGYKKVSELLMEEKEKIERLWATSGYIITDDGEKFEFDMSDELYPELYVIEMSGKYFWLGIEIF